MSPPNPMKPSIDSQAPPRAQPNPTLDSLDRAREAITWFRPMEDREADHAPLSAALIRRIFRYARRYRGRRN